MARQKQKNSQLNMSPYISAHNEELQLKKKKTCFIAKTQTHMIENIKKYFRELYKPNLLCVFCNRCDCDTKHLL